jgi:hypothetical protein
MDRKAEKEEKLKQAKDRSDNVLGGFCGFYGSCGAGIGVGIAFSIMTHTTPLSGKTWGNANEAAGKALLNISKYNGPRCCKRTVFSALNSAIVYLDKFFGVVVDKTDTVKCYYNKFNKECLKDSCEFYNR